MYVYIYMCVCMCVYMYVYTNRLNICNICWCAVRPFGADPLIGTFSPLVQPVLWPVLGARDQPFPGWCTVLFLRLICMAIGDMLSIFWTSLRHAALYLCWRKGWPYLYWNYNYAQLYRTKLIVAYEYCWYYGVLGDRTVFLIGVMCWFFCRSRDLSCTCTVCHVGLI